MIGWIIGGVVAHSFSKQIRGVAQSMNGDSFHSVHGHWPLDGKCSHDKDMCVHCAAYLAKHPTYYIMRDGRWDEKWCYERA